MNGVVKVPKTEYLRLRKIAERFELLRTVFTDDFFAEPAKNKKHVIQELRKTGRYSKAFLSSVARGLKESSHFTR